MYIQKMWIYRLEFSLNKDLPPLSLTRLGLSVKTLQAGCSHAEGFASAFPAQQDEQSRLGRQDLVATSHGMEMLGNYRAKKPETRVRFGKVASNPFGHMKFDQKRPTNYWNLRRYRF